MPAADERIRAVVGDLGDGGGDEVLVSEIGPDPAIDVLGDLREAVNIDGSGTKSPRTMVAVRTAAKPLPRTSPISIRTAFGRRTTS